MKKTIPKWNPAELPFLEEKLEFRKKNIEGLNYNGTVFCAYAGEESRLTNFYAKKFAEVIALDKEFPLPLPKNVTKIQMSDKQFFKKFNKFELPRIIEVLDVDPYGSPIPFLQQFFSKYHGVVKRVIVTDGAITIAKLRRRMNWYKYYGILENGVRNAEPWIYKHFPCILFSKAQKIFSQNGYTIVYFTYEFNRYRTAVYARFDVVKGID